MAVLLSLETATSCFSVALYKESTLLAYHKEEHHHMTASLLVPRIRELLQRASLSMDQLEGLVLSEGPGSYTGLRIGTATAKGMCYALHIPLVTVNTLVAMAAQAISQVPPEALLCPMLDARRMEVYMLMTNTKLEIIHPTQAVVIEKNSFLSVLRNQQVYFMGEGMIKSRDIIHHHNARFLDRINPLATTIGPLGYTKWQQNKFVDLFAFEPLYLKDYRVIPSKKKQTLSPKK